jgi:hypothetical protein
MMLVDLSTPYQYGWIGEGSCYAVQSSYDRLEQWIISQRLEYASHFSHRFREAYGLSPATGSTPPSPDRAERLFRSASVEIASRPACTCMPQRAAN